MKMRGRARAAKTGRQRGSVVPAPTIRLRMTVLYGLLFLISGAVLLTIGYALVRHNLGVRRDFRDELRKLGLPARSGPPYGGRLGFGPGSPEARGAAAALSALRSDALHRLLIEYVFALVAMTLISVVAGWLMAGRVLAPLRQITATARRVSGENLNERIALAGPADELKELADTFDGMLARLHHAFASQRRFVANASHELRTPLAIMRTEVDVALADPHADVAELRAMGDAVRETVDRCERLIESLLMLARSEAADIHREPVDLAAIAGYCVTDLQSRTRRAGVRVTDDLEPAWVRGEPALLERMISNLIENGVRHNVEGGFLELTTRCEAGRVRLTVANGGPRIDPEQAQTLTEPFVRLARAGVGFGLGLSIVRSVVEAHGGTLTVAAPRSGGLVVGVELPAAAPDPGGPVADTAPARVPGALR